jgi:hypothetical protein
LSTQKRISSRVNELHHEAQYTRSMPFTSSSECASSLRFMVKGRLNGFSPFACPNFETGRDADLETRAYRCMSLNLERRSRSLERLVPH